MFILMRGDLHAMDIDKETFLYKLPEGSVFGEGTVLRQLEVRDSSEVLPNTSSMSHAAVKQGVLHMLIVCMQFFDIVVVQLALQGFLKAKRSENMWCKTPCYMLRIAQEDIADLLEHYPQLLDSLRALHRDRQRR